MSSWSKKPIADSRFQAAIKFCGLRNSLAEEIWERNLSRFTSHLLRNVPAGNSVAQIPTSLTSLFPTNIPKVEGCSAQYWTMLLKASVVLGTGRLSIREIRRFHLSQRLNRDAGRKTVTIRHFVTWKQYALRRLCLLLKSPVTLLLSCVLYQTGKIHKTMEQSADHACSRDRCSNAATVTTVGVDYTIFADQCHRLEWLRFSILFFTFPW